MMKWGVACLLAIVLMLAAAWHFWFNHDPPPPTWEEAVGVYVGTYQGYGDRVELKKNQWFNQILKTPNGETMKSSGTWNLINYGLILDGYIYFIDEKNEGTLDNPQRRSQTFIAYLGVMIRDWDIDFYKLSKQQVRSAEQGGNDQAPTDSESKIEGIGRPKPESKGCSQKRVAGLKCLMKK